MQRKPTLGHARLQVYQHRLRIALVLEPHHEIVRVANEYHRASLRVIPPTFDPSIKRVVQEDVGQQRANQRPLRRPYFRRLTLSALQDTDPQPLPYQPQYPLARQDCLAHNCQTGLSGPRLAAPTLARLRSPHFSKSAMLGGVGVTSLPVGTSHSFTVLS